MPRSSMLAYCGIVCTDCSAYIATQKGDIPALEQIAAKWGKELNLALTWEDCRCDGCLATTGRQIDYSQIFHENWIRIGCGIPVSFSPGGRREG